MSDTIPFSSLKAQIKRTIWPTQGPPEFLSEDGIDRFMVEGMVEIQKWVPCLRQRHETVYRQCSTYFQCGRTVFDAPKGRIRKLYTVVGSGYCDPVTYDMSTLPEILAWSRGFMITGTPARPVNTGYPVLPLGMDYPSASTDNKYGRALSGLWCIDKDRIIMAPWIQSNEMVVLEWSGLKRSYNAEDLVSNDPMLEKTLRWYTKTAFEGMYGRDPNLLVQAQRFYDDALSELMHECNEETKLRDLKQSTEERYVLLDTLTEATAVAPDPYVETPLVFAVIGDYGLDSANEAAVATLVKGWKPSFILTTGDNNYPSGAQSTIDANIGKYYRSFIYPYQGSQPLGPGEAAATENMFWPTPGNHDLDAVVSTVAGQPYFAYFTGIYGDISSDFYDFVVGNVHFFAINTGFNSAGTDVSLFGNFATSPQADTIRYRIAQSTAKWKIVFGHHPYRTSGLNYAPGYSQLLWIQDLPVDLVMAGHSHAFEAIQPAGKPVLAIVGCSGSDLVGESATVDPDQTFFSAASFGALRLTSLCASLKIEFINTAGTAAHTITLSK